jgi:hypothetical protein
MTLAGSHDDSAAPGGGRMMDDAQALAEAIHQDLRALILLLELETESETITTTALHVAKAAAERALEHTVRLNSMALGRSQHPFNWGCRPAVPG